MTAHALLRNYAAILLRLLVVERFRFDPERKSIECYTEECPAVRDELDAVERVLAGGEK